MLQRLEQFKELFDIGVFPEPILDKTKELPPFLKSIAPIRNQGMTALLLDYLSTEENRQRGAHEPQATEYVCPHGGSFLF